MIEKESVNLEFEESFVLATKNFLIWKEGRCWGVDMSTASDEVSNIHQLIEK